MSVRIASLVVFAIAAFIAFGDLLMAHSYSSPQTLIDEVGRSIGNTVTGVAEWFGLG